MIFCVEPLPVACSELLTASKVVSARRPPVARKVTQTHESPEKGFNNEFFACSEGTSSRHIVSKSLGRFCTRVTLSDEMVQAESTTSVHCFRVSCEEGTAEGGYGQLQAAEQLTSQRYHVREDAAGCGEGHSR